MKLHCWTSARLREISQAKYKDLICMSAWKDGEPEIKPKHPVCETLNPTPPLYTNGLLFLLAIFISACAFRDYTIEDVWNARAPLDSSFMVMKWAEIVLETPVFPEISVDGPTAKARNESSGSHACSEWAKRAGFPDGIGLRAARGEVFIKIDADSALLLVFSCVRSQHCSYMEVIR
ncbi:hypothetical protein AYL99_12039 [Fonsecaea erecta]|uniref:Uncharacterized protein n=1 Tax=Fonsecaea erecta TaxID=1367422 RepID=A0A178Z3T5_9EURO|nr:hypothetical protein AYL99_12039 [Fonsecaea erecta]OAP53755.1 hypothetical protein AYL99_12039 [Fonsecaea erecta]